MKNINNFIVSILLSIIILNGCFPDGRHTVISEQPEALSPEEIAGKRLTPEILWKFGRIGEHVVSPDGQTVAYTVTRFNMAENSGRTTIWSIPAGGGNATCLTADITSSCGNPRWMPSGRLAYLSASKDGMQIWSMNANGSDKRQISFIQGGVTGFEFSPKGDAVMFLKRVSTGGSPKEQYPDLTKANAITADELMYRHWDSWTDYEASHIWISYEDKNGIYTHGLDIMEGEPYEAPLAPFFSIAEITWSPCGKYIAYTCKKLRGSEYALSTNTDIYLYDVENGTTKNITDGMSGYDKYPVFSPCGSILAFQSMATPGYEADNERLMLINLTTGEMVDLTENYDNNAESFSWSPDGSEIRFISGVRATYQVYSVDVATKNIRAITSGAHNYSNIKLAGNLLICSKTTKSMATELFIVEPQTGKEQQLTFVNKNIYDAVKMGKVEERSVRTTDGKDMLVWVVYPPDFDETKQYPALLYCQGGPQSAVSQFFSYRWNLQLMAANGYIVVAPNRRGLPTFGQEWNRQISGDYGGQNMLDLLSAIDDVKKEPYVDENRLGAVGASYGGFTVYWLAGHHEKRFKTFIAHCGIFNFESMYGSTEEYFFMNFDMGGAYWEKPRPKNYDFSPHLAVDKWDTPILVIHGVKDYRVPYAEGLQAFNAAQLRGIPSRLLIFPEEGHWIMSPQNSMLWQREFFSWLDKWLKK